MADYKNHLHQTIAWLVASIRDNNTGSSAYYSPLLGWSSPYPETTGYIIPTLIRYSDFQGGRRTLDLARSLGEWLLQIQRPNGYWFEGLYRTNATGQASIFNTAQILKGMVALYEKEGNRKWLDSAVRGGEWLARGVDQEGLWAEGNYTAGFNPSYYTQVAWPMLLVSKAAETPFIREKAQLVLDAILARRKANGVFSGWAFMKDEPAFTHTIAYTIRGFIESSLLLNDWDKYASPTLQALEFIQRRAELSRGYLPGAFDESWEPKARYTCLTGNAQLAICLLLVHSHEADLRLVNAAAKLIDVVCGVQRSPFHRLLTRSRGSVPGSIPFWGRYMFLRYPNWAAKYHADALMALLVCLKEEGL
jgi:hypothetical protein